MKDSYGMLHRTSSHHGWPSSVENANIEFLLRSIKSNQSKIKATHENHNHFQARAAYNFWFWHDLAVGTATTNLFGGLLINAYADYFIQDLFAPGHVASLRDENSHGLPSLAWHDE